MAEGSQIEEAHALVRDWLKINYNSETAVSVPVLYGGSVNSANAKELIELNGVDGFLIGGASLKVDSFNEIIQIAEKFYKE